MTYARKEELAEGITLYQGDCRDILPTLGKVDAVVTDPPYGIGADKGKNVRARSFNGSKPVPSMHCPDATWDDERPPAELIRQCVAAGGSAIVWGGNYFADLLPAQGRWLWWDKCQTMPSYGDGELAWTNLPQTTPKRIIYANNKIFANRLERFHPTQKPIEVMRWCLGFLPDARTILDPFMGSGTTGVACVQLGRQFIGIELDPGYFDIACRRISEELKRPRLPLDDKQPQPVQEAMQL